MLHHSSNSVTKVTPMVIILVICRICIQKVSVHGMAGTVSVTMNKTRFSMKHLPFFNETQ